MRKGRKPITLPAGILILLFTLMPLGGCQQDNGDFQRQLSAADSLMQTDADSAFRMLCAMDSLICKKSGDKCSLVINDYSYDGVCGFTYYTSGGQTSSSLSCIANTSGSKRELKSKWENFSHLQKH